MAYSMTRSPARLCLRSREGKLCYYGRLEYDFLAFFCALLPTSLSRYVYSIIFVFLRLCSSHQLLYTLTKYVNVKTITTTTNNMCSQVRHPYMRHKGYVRIHLFRSMIQVNLYLYIPLHSLHTRTYIVYIQQCGARWYEPVIPVAPVSFRAHITTKLHELKTVLDEGRSRWRT